MPTLLSIQSGDRADYLSLAGHHYRPGHPATYCRVLVIRDASPSPTDRFMDRAGLPRVVAVLVESLPSLSCGARDIALADRYAGLSLRGRGRAANREVRCISRVIVDPRYRGRGLAVRLVRHALATATTPITEALAAMGHASPFFERAGMTRIDRSTPERDARLLQAIRFLSLSPAALAMPSLIQQDIAGLSKTQQTHLDRELTRWYRSGIGRAQRDTPTRQQCLHAAKKHLLSRPVYYIKLRTTNQN